MLPRKTLYKSHVKAEDKSLFPEWWEPYSKQKRAFFSGKRLSLVRGSTQCGKSTAALRALVEIATSSEPTGNLCWWVSPTFAQAVDVMRKLKINLNPLAGVSYNWSKLQVTFPNGNRLDFKSADNPDSLYGYTVMAAVLDEASRVKEKVFSAIETRMATIKNPYFFVMGNVNGDADWFYAKCQATLAGNNDNIIFTEINADDAIEAGVLHRESLEAMRASMPRDDFLELMYNIPRRNGGQPINKEIIENSLCLSDDLAPVYFGVDIARKHDYTAIVGINEAGEVVFLTRLRHESWEFIYDRIRQHIRHFPAFIDATGNGGDISFESLVDKCDGLEQYIFTQKSKAYLIDKVRLGLENGELRLAKNLEDFAPETNDGNLNIMINELLNLGQKFTALGVSYEANGNGHDDFVMALGLANAKYIKEKENYLNNW